jgi:hypothetical protein
VTDDPYAEPEALDGTDHGALVALVAATAGQGPDALRRLWDDLVAQLGVDATSRLWQEGLAESDASQQT